MSDEHDQPQLQPEPPTGLPVPPALAPARLPSKRAAAVLAAAMLALGVAVGAAIGPSPESSFAGGASEVIKRLPVLLAAISAHSSSTGASGRPAGGSPPATPQAEPPVRAHGHAAASTPAASPATSPAPSGSGEATPEGSSPASGGSHSKLPATTAVWLIQLAGGTFTSALAQPSAAPYIDSQLVPASTLLSGWSALQGSAFASDAATLAPVAPGSSPALIHSIVQPPCPEGPAGASCAAETPGQLTAADEFLKATLAQITTTAAYREHGLIVVTFATVGIAAQSGIPAGASTSTLTSQPPGGVALMSPFARAGLRSSAAFDPASPAQSLEGLLR
jgi:hypothetical protein